MAGPYWYILMSIKIKTIIGQLRLYKVGSNKTPNNTANGAETESENLHSLLKMFTSNPKAPP